MCAISIIQVNDNVLIVPEHASNSTFNREGVSELRRTFTPEHVVIESSVVNPGHAVNRQYRQGRPVGVTAYLSGETT